MCRRDFKATLNVLTYRDSSDASSSSEEDDIDFLFCELAFRPKRKLGPCLNLQDLSDLDCEQLFRYFKHSDICMCSLVNFAFIAFFCNMRHI